MKKIIIDGGDNCYCCACGGVCDRRVLEEDTDAKTLKYIDGRGLCLGKYCMRVYVCDDGTELRRDWNNKIRAYRDGVELPCVVRNQKWGKDGEYGKTRGMSLGASASEFESGVVALYYWTSDDAEKEYWAQYDRENYQRLKETGAWKGMREFMTATGWKLLTK